MPEVKSNETLVCRGHLDASFAKSVAFKPGALLRSYLEARDENDVSIPLRSGFVHDAAGSNLPSTAASDDLGIVGTFGSAALTLQTIDQKANGTPTAAYARFLVPIDSSFDLGETLLIKVTAGMITTVASETATIDVEAYVNDGAGGVGSDLCGTAAQNMNSLTAAEFEFEIDSASLNWGDELDLRLAITIEDTATGTAVIGEIAKLVISRDIRG